MQAAIRAYRLGDPPLRLAAAAALGNLDGVHRGHQAVLAAASAAARRLECPLVAIVLEPHPRRVFKPEAPPFRLQSAAQRARALAAHGAETTVEVRFEASVAALTDTDFARSVLSAGLGVAHVSVGEDFRFGRNRMGDAAMLARLGEEFGFGVSVVEAVTGANAGERVSSSAVRRALAEGRVRDAAHLLGRPFAVEGVVAQGFQRGRTIGFPTANIGLSDYQRPAYGVYATLIDVGDGLLRAGVANVGVKPTVETDAAPLLEAHVFDFKGDLYGRTIEVSLIEFLRPERKFESFEALTRQIGADVAEARRLLGLTPQAPIKSDAP